MITISPGHWSTGGAVDLLNEVTEARKVVNRVVAILRSNGVTTHHVEDNTSKNQQQNLTYLVKQHNATDRNLDVSVHFNSSARKTQGIGTEVLYYDAKALSAKVSAAIAKAGEFIDRGAKERKELAFLNGTHKPAILIEVCFVSSETDVKLYRKNFEAICQAIAKVLAEQVGKLVPSTPTTVEDKKEEVVMANANWNPGSTAIRTETENFIAQAVKDGIIQASHSMDLQSGAMTTDRLLGLYITIQQRRATK